MKKIETSLLAVLLATAALLAAAAHASCPDADAKPFPVLTTDDATVGYRCAPAPLGKGTKPIVRSNAAGAVAWWYCHLDNSTVWQIQMAAATSAWLAAAPYADLNALFAATDGAALNALKTANATADLALLEEVWCPHRDDMLAAWPAPDPLPKFVIAKNGSTTTRPAYFRNPDGTLTSTKDRAPVLVPGNDPTLSGTSWYCNWAGAPTGQTVALCTKAP